MCGLAGIISIKQTSFNIDHFNILGTLNDERGGDSCGIFIDGITEYGIHKQSLFRTFTSNIKYPETASIALLHCRKASPGYNVTLNQAQPIIIKENNEIKFVLMHNGTISNIQSLVTEYFPNETFNNMSDSQILAKIIYKFGYEVLEKYTGCAVLVMIDYRIKTPEILIFKGSSCYNEPNTNCERPLYYMIYNNKFYFSSMFSSLYCIDHNSTIYNFPVNKLCKIQNNEVRLIKNIDRTKLKKFTYYVNNNYVGIDDDYDYYPTNIIKYDKQTGIYMLNNQPAHGPYICYPSGYLINKSNQKTGDQVFYFFRGRLLYNKECFNFLKDISDLFDDDVLPVYCSEIIDYFAYNPRIINKVLTTVDSKFNYIPYLNGYYVNLFSNSEEVVVENKNISTKYIYPLKAIAIFNETVKKTYFNFDELEKQILKYITNRITE